MNFRKLRDACSVSKFSYISFLEIERTPFIGVRALSKKIDAGGNPKHRKHPRPFEQEKKRRLI